MSVTQTSKLANRHVERERWYGRIKELMRVYDTELCIADIAKSMNAEKSTISARLNEMCKYGMIHYAGVKASRTTGIKSKHYRLKVQETLF